MAQRLYFLIQLLTAFGTSLLGVALATDCPDTWVADAGSCYLFGTENPLKFFEAENFCRQHHGSHLVHVNNADENAFLKSFLNGLKPANYWMGLTDERIEGHMVWYDTDTIPTYTDWHPGQPDNGIGTQLEDCGHFHKDWNYQWNDNECDNLFEPLCEISGEGVDIIG